MNYSNVLLIDNSVPDYQLFIDSVNQNTFPIVYSSSMTRNELIEKFELFTTIDRIGLIFRANPNCIFVEEKTFFSQEIITVLVSILKKYFVKNIDFLACNTLPFIEWTTLYSDIESQTGVIVGASNDKTGNIKYGGNWIMESTSEDIEIVYFTNTIQYYKYVLDLGQFSIIIKSDGTLWGTGYNTYSAMLGLGYTGSVKTFTNITVVQSTLFKSKTVNSVSCGMFHTVVLMTDNTIWGAGWNYYGVEPIGNKFTQIPFNQGQINKVACGAYHTIIWTEGNKLWGVGRGYEGQLGNGPNPTSYYNITQLTGITGTIKDITCGAYFTIILTTNNKLLVCGQNLEGQFGLGNKSNYSVFTTVNIDTITGRIPEFVSAGDLHVVVTMTDGTIWGAGMRYCLGINIPQGLGEPNFVQALNTNNYNISTRKPKYLICGYSYTIVLMTDDTLWGAGGGYSGEMGPGDSSRFFFYYSQMINLPTTISKVWAGQGNTLLLGTNNVLYVCGNNNEGQLGFTTPTNSVNYITSLSDVISLPKYFIQNPIETIASNFTPLVGTTNTSVTLSGSNLSNISNVLFGNASATINRLTGTSINVSAPVNSGNVSIVLRDNTGKNISMPGSFTYLNPNVSNISPLVGTTNTILTISGINLMNTSFVRIQDASVPFTINSSLSLNASVNASSGNASVVVTDNLGNNTSFSGNFTYQNPAVTTFTPLVGTRNTSVTLSGSNLSNTSYVLFGNASATINRVTGTDVNVSVPVNSGNVSIVVRDNLGNNASMPGNFTYQNPTVTGFTPDAGASNSSVTITGSNLSNTSYVLFGNASATINQVTGTSVNVSIPSNVGNVSVVLIDNLGNNTSAANNFIYQNVVVSGFTPIFGPKNTMITITGEKLNNASFVKIKGLNTSFVINSSVSISASTPNTSGNTSVVVVDNYGNNIYASDLFSYQNLNISSITPLVGTTNTSVTITGSSLTNTSFVKFGETNASINRITATSVNVSAPSNSENVSLSLIDNDGNRIYQGTFIYQNPSILSISPTAGTKNTSIVLTGTNLMNISFVRVDNKNTSFLINSSLSLNISAPNASDGNASIQLVDRLSNVIHYSGNFLYQNTSVSGFTPIVGNKNTSITISGVNLSNTSFVKFGTINASINRITGTSVNVSAPANSANVSIIVGDTFGNTVNLPGNFTYQIPTVTSISPLFGPPNTAITITGTNMMNTSFVRIQGASVPFTINSSRSLVATVNASTGSASIVIVDNVGNNTSFSGNFTYQTTGATSFTPLLGTKNTILTITGTNLLNTSFVFFGNVSAPISFTSGTTVKVFVPTNSGNVSVVVRDKLGNNVSLPLNFTYQNPSVSGISPSVGTKNTIITITGSNLANTSFVRIQGSSVPFTINSSVSINATVNASSGNASVVVVDRLGNNTSFSGNFIYQNPTASSFTPSSGTANMSVTLSGTNLSNTSFVLFGTANASINRITGTSVNVSVPVNSGNVSIVLRDRFGNNVSMPGNFAYQNTGITSISPTSGPQNTLITIVGSGLTNISSLTIGNINTSFTILQNGTIQALAPNSSGNVSVVLTDYLGNNIRFSRNFVYQNTTISGFTPTFGTRNTSVTISGVNLANTSFVKFGTTNATIRNITATSINVSAPINSDNVSILLIDKTGNSMSAPGTFFYQNPAITTISPSVGTVNTNLTITGENLSNTKTIKIGTSSVANTKFTINSSSSINVSVPASSSNGNVSVVLLDTLGNNTSFSGNFTYKNPNISSITPLFGAFQTQVTISGVNMSNTSFVKFGTVNASIVSQSDTSLSVLAPVNSGNTFVFVGDVFNNSIRFNVPFSYQSTSISNITPTTATKNATLVIFGSNLANTSYVTIGNISTEFQINSSASIQTTIPDSSGNAQVAVIDNTGKKTTFSKNFTYANPTLFSINSSGVPRSTVTITGTNLFNTSVVKFNNISTPFTISKNAITINASVPFAYGNVSVKVIDKFGNEDLVPGSFLYKTPAVTQLSAESSPTNTTISIYGMNLINTSYVSFGNIRTKKFTKTSNNINVSVPAGTGNVSVVVTDTFGNNVSFVRNFIYQNTYISSVTPINAQPKSTLAIEGGYLLNTSAVLFGQLNASFVVQSDSLINVSVPSSSGNVSLSVRDNLGNITSFSENFTYKSMVIENFSPLIGVKNTRILLNGNELSPVVSVTFGNVSAAFTVISNYQIEVIVPEINSSSSIVLTDNYGNTVTSSQTFSRKNPVVTETDINSGVVGETLTLYGSDLSIMNYVVFGTEQATNVNVSNTQITCKIPYGLGNVSLQVLDNFRNTVQVPGTFTYMLDVPKPNLVLLNAPSFTTNDASNNIYTSSGSTVTKNNTLFYTNNRAISGISVNNNMLYMAEYDHYAIARYNMSTQVKLSYSIDASDRVQPNIIKVYKNKLYAVCNANPSTTDPDFLYIFDLSSNAVQKRSLLPAYTFQGVAIYNTNIYFSAVIKNNPSQGRVCKADLTGLIIDETFITNLNNPIDLTVVKGKIYIDGQTVIIYDLDAPEEPLATYQSDPTSEYNSVFHGTDASGNSVIYMTNTTTNTIETIMAPSVVTTEILATQISPSSGTENTHVMITGQNFLADDLTPKIASVLFQSVAATNLTFVSSTLLYCDAPAGGGNASIQLVDTSSNVINTTLQFIYQTPIILDHYPRVSVPDDIMYIYGKHMNLVTSVLIGTVSATFVLIRVDYLRVQIPQGTGTNLLVTLVDTLNNTISDSTKRFSYSVPSSTICFPAGTLVKSDQGNIEIQKLIPGIHTIYHKMICAITETYSLDQDLVCIEQDAIRKNYPYKQTFISPRHKLYYKGKMKAAYRLVGKQKGVSFVPYHGEKLYNVLLKNHGKMNIHGLICETLHPNNPAAHYYSKLIKQ